MPILQWIANNTFVIYIILFFGFPVLARILKGVKDRRARAAARRAVEQAQMEALRTGRGGAQASYPQPTPITRPNPVPLQTQFPAQAAPQATVPNTAPVGAQAPASGQPRYITLPGGVILELPPAPPSQQTAARTPQPRPQAQPRPQPRAQAQALPQSLPQPRPQPGQTAAQAQQRQRNMQARAQDDRRNDRERERQQREVEARRQKALQRDRDTAGDAYRLRGDPVAPSGRMNDATAEGRALRNAQSTAESTRAVDDAYRQPAGGGATARGANRAALIAGVPVNPGEWRRALMLREILNQPVSQRDPIQSGEII